VLVFAFVLAVLGGYLLGSIPFGLVVTQAAGLGDIRNIGSGNIGATNVLRTGRKDLALATLVLDAGKAAMALLAARWLTNGAAYQLEIGLVAGAAAFIGHCFPIWLNFKGGKGVATYFGLLLFGMPPLGLAVGVVWIAVAMIFRYSSLAALAAVTVAPVLAMIGSYTLPEVSFLVLLAALVYWRHAANIDRLRAGTEPRIGAKKDADAASPPAAPAPGAPAPAAQPPAET
jgi:glycerol-3-phosphate acyltransferase PlsY